MRGRILFNGNIPGVDAFCERARPWLLDSAPHGRAPNVLIVTAAWGENEFDEGHLKAALNRVGVPSRHVDGFDRQIRNLCVWHLWNGFLERRPDVRAVWRELADAQEATRQFYLEKTAFHADLVRRGARFARQRVPGWSLGAVPERPRDPIRPDGSETGTELLAAALSRELVRSIDVLVDNDARFLQVLRDAEHLLHARTGLRADPEWRRLRDGLEERILEADAVLFLGGSPRQLLEPVRFFDLRPALLETLRRGATFFAISAGALLLCERMIVYDERSGDPMRRDFRLFDAGLGLVGGLQVLPHCMDRIQTDDPDNLAYLSRRFSTHLCVGLNEESFLLVEMAGPSATSVGRGDGVYVFGADGVKARYDAGEAIPLA